MNIRSSKKLNTFLALTLSIIFMSLTFIFLDNSYVNAETAASATGKITESDGVIVRKSYSTSSSMVRILNQNSTFIISSEKFTSKIHNTKKYRWYYTSYNGYVRSDLASITYKSKKATTTASIYARNGAGTSFTAKKTLKKGSTIYVLLKSYDKSGNLWYRIKYGTAHYYVRGSYVKFSTTTTTPTITKIDMKGVTTDSVNVRSGPGTKYPIKATYAKGKALTLVGKTTVSGVVWYKLSNGYYICGTYVKITTSSDGTTSMNKKGMTTDSVNARSGPGTSYSIKTVYSTGTILTIVASKSVSGTVWYKTSSGYYVCGDYITFNIPSTGTTGVVTGFPSSYTKLLNNLKERHPNWIFKPVDTGLDWKTALSKMQSSNANTIHSVYKDSYRDIGKGSYNFLTGNYIPKDGSSWFKASNSAVAYYMDPRNWLSDSSIFMFEDHAYNSAYQTSTVVKKVLKYNNTLYNAGTTFVSAGKKYNINPVYLASKSYNELGASSYMINGHTFTYGGKTFKSCYNAFNIGATDTTSGSAAINGLVYANGGYYGNNTSYGRKWSTLTKAIYGGACYIADAFVDNDQDTGYLEHFNVMNGLSNVGTHVYMTAIYAPNSMASTVYSDYKSYGITNEKIVFKIPVYRNMPTSVSKQPGSGNNNCYLRALNFKYGSTTKNLVICNSSNINTMYYTRFSRTVPNSVKSVTINATKYSSGAYVSGAGVKSLKVGTNKFTVKCKSSSGVTRTYTITITRKA